MKTLYNIAHSIITDLKSWKQIKLNRWHLHAPIALLIGCALMYFMRNLFDGVAVWFQMFAPSFLGFCLLWLFELWQQGSRIIGEKERFESNKDLFVGEFFLIIGVVLTFLYIC